MGGATELPFLVATLRVNAGARGQDNRGQVPVLHVPVPSGSG